MACDRELASTFTQTRHPSTGKECDSVGRGYERDGEGTGGVLIQVECLRRLKGARVTTARSRVDDGLKWLQGYLFRGNIRDGLSKLRMWLS